MKKIDFGMNFDMEPINRLLTIRYVSYGIIDIFVARRAWRKKKKNALHGG